MSPGATPQRSERRGASTSPSALAKLGVNEGPRPGDVLSVVHRSRIDWFQNSVDQKKFEFEICSPTKSVRSRPVVRSIQSGGVGSATIVFENELEAFAAAISPVRF